MFGFPDILFSPSDTLSRLLTMWTTNDCDVALGLFETDRPDKSDTIDVTWDGRVKQILVKEPTSQHRFAWITAIWGTRFSDYLTNFVENWGPKHTEHTNHPPELHLGHVLQNAIDDKMSILGLPIPDGRYIDIGTPDDAKRIHEFTRRIEQL